MIASVSPDEINITIFVVRFHNEGLKPVPKVYLNVVNLNVGRNFRHLRFNLRGHFLSFSGC